MKIKVYGSLGRTRSEEEDEDVDVGWAWIVLFASFMTNVIILGANFAFSVFYAEWTEYFDKGPTATSLLISMSCALVLAAGAPASILANRFGARTVIMVGGVISAAGFAASAFVTSFELLFVSYGLLTGLGNGLAFVPSFGVLPLYFRKRRNFATAIVTAGSGLGMILYSMLFEYLISTYSWRGAMLITSGIVLNVVPCGAVIFKRECRSGTAGFSQYAEFSLFKEFSFYVSMAHFFFLGSQFIYVVFCLRYAVDTLHISRASGAFVVSSMGATNVIGRILVALLSINPKFATANVRFFLLHFSSLCVAVTLSCYPLCQTFTMACLVSALIGLSWGVRFSLTPGLQMDISDPKRFNAAWGYLTLVTGISFFIFPPLAGKISKSTGDSASAFYFAGVMSFMAFLLCPLLHFLWWSKQSEPLDLEESKFLLEPSSRNSYNHTGNHGKTALYSP
ncbi:hypothetical protein RvY_18539 [Ramazzottius varieornatus]|uniref:Major facilitator superfamily (MFS) profile domain-containing protein n=1 Tax=Ramazzottius varieornatus TaxID=947166 RepID=A0A1D1W651_RAMVA|nr:hypothetical protein RvY_18539 [Ramazzottius varieornatus]